MAEVTTTADVTASAPAVAPSSPLPTSRTAMQTLSSAHAALLRELPECPVQLPRTALFSARKPPRHNITSATAAGAAGAASATAASPQTSSLPLLGASASHLQSTSSATFPTSNNSNNNNNNNSISHGSSGGNNNERELANKATGVFSVSAAAQLLRLGQLDMNVRLDFVATNRVVAVLEKAIERLQLLRLVHASDAATAAAAAGASAAATTTTSANGGSAATAAAVSLSTSPSLLLSSQQQQQQQQQQHRAQDELFASQHNKSRSAATYAGPQGAMLGTTTTAVTAALAAATQTQQRGRPTVAQRMHAQQQLEARYGALLLATRHARSHDGVRAAATAAADGVDGDEDAPAHVAALDVTCLTHARNHEQASLLRELHHVAAQLRDHNKLLCTQLQDNPNDADNWNKIRNERDELIALLQAAVAELTSGYRDAAQQQPPSSLSQQQQQSLSLSRVSSRSQLHTRADASATSPSRAGRLPHEQQQQQQQQSLSRRNSLSARRASLPSSSLHTTTIVGGNVSDTDSQTTASSPQRMLQQQQQQQQQQTSLTRRFGSTAHLHHRSLRRSAPRPRVPLTSSYAQFARTVLQEQAAQRWADELVRKERELNQNVKQLQSDLLRERGAKEQEVRERSAHIALLQTRLRELRRSTQQRLADARAAVEAATHGIQRDAADADRVVADAAAALTRTLHDEEQTHAMFAEHLHKRTAAAEALAVAWERRNAHEITRMEAAKLDAEQTRQQCAEHLAECKRNELVQLELQKRRRRARARAQARRDAADARREAEYDATSVLQAAIAGMFTRQALAKLLKTASGGGGGGKRRKRTKSASGGK